MVPFSMTLSDLWPGFQSHDIFWSRMWEKRRILKTKLLLHKRKLYLTCGMVLYLLTLLASKRVTRVCLHKLSFLLLIK